MVEAALGEVERRRLWDGGRHHGRRRQSELGPPLQVQRVIRVVGADEAQPGVVCLSLQQQHVELKTVALQVATELVHTVQQLRLLLWEVLQVLLRLALSMGVELLRRMRRLLGRLLGGVRTVARLCRGRTLVRV